MSRVIVLDAGPLGLVAHRRGVTKADECRAWIAGAVARGERLVVPEIADYEVRRELLRLNKDQAIGRLDEFIASAAVVYLPITTASMRHAAQLWASTRKQGVPTADPHELDADVILAAQALTAGFAPSDIVVATSNVGHLGRFLQAAPWEQCA